MKKALAVTFAAFVLMITLSACTGRVKHDSYKEIYNRYSDIKSYIAEAEITVKSNLTTNTYLVKQYFLAPDNYKTEITAPDNMAGTGYSFCDGEVRLNSSGGEVFSISDYVPEDRNYVFINDFFANYYKSEDTFVETSGGIKNDCTVLKNVLSEGNPYRHSQTVKINNSSLLPEKLVTYDMDNNEVLSVEYKSFTFDTELEKEIFK